MQYNTISYTQRQHNTRLDKILQGKSRQHNTMVHNTTQANTRQDTTTQGQYKTIQDNATKTSQYI